MKNEDLSTHLADRLLSHYHNIPPQPNSPHRQRRLLVALAGGPGSGKSTIAESIVSATCDRGVKAQVISIEGFVKGKDRIEKEGLQGREGALDTFDGDAVVSMLEKLRELGPGHELRAPGCDEETFEPVPDAQLIEADTEIVVFEGIYLLASTPPWRRIEDVVDEKWFIHVDPGLVRERVAHRRVQKGKARDMGESFRSYDEFDGKNNDWIWENRYETDLVVESRERDVAVRYPDRRVVQ